jgi:Domain of unknown function (DUF5069)
MVIPAPRERLAGCIWLPRIIAKARLQQLGQLPREYQARFGAPSSVDIDCDEGRDRLAAKPWEST